MLVYYFVPFIVSNRYLLFWVSNGRNSVTVQNWTHVYMNFFDHKDLGNHSCSYALKSWNTLYNSGRQRRMAERGIWQVLWREEVCTGLRWWDVRERANLENLGVERIMLKWIFRRSVGCVEWIGLAQDRENWRAYVKTVIDFLILRNKGDFVTSWGNVSFSRRTLLRGVSSLFRPCLKV